MDVTLTNNHIVIPEKESSTLYLEVFPKIKTKRSFECDMDTRMYMFLPCCQDTVGDAQMKPHGQWKVNESNQQDLER